MQTGIAADGANRLIASNKFGDTGICNSEGGKLGSVYNFMVGKR
ncbi:hypothetical protein [Sphingopyxis sp. PAMC25046]|nr:hypothetical protein [Sphingopyxis sp. PAMC25046]